MKSWEEVIAEAKGPQPIDNCDMCVPTHKVKQEDVIVIKKSEVAAYALAYAKKFLDGTLRTLKSHGYTKELSEDDKFEIWLIGMTLAKGGVTHIYDPEGKKESLTITDRTDWMTCKKGLEEWEGYKRKFPIKGH